MQRGGGDHSAIHSPHCSMWEAVSQSSFSYQSWTHLEKSLEILDILFISPFCTSHNIHNVHLTVWFLKGLISLYSIPWFFSIYAWVKINNRQKHRERDKQFPFLVVFLCISYTKDTVRNWKLFSIWSIHSLNIW